MTYAAILTGDTEPLTIVRDPALPPLLTRAANLVEAIATHVAHVAAGGQAYVSEDAYAARLAVCDPCDRRTEAWECSSCGCNLRGDVLGKARYASMVCPLSKWPGDPQPTE